MEQGTSTTRIALKWGFISGLISSVLTVVNYVFDLYRNSLFSTLGFGLLVVFTIFIYVLAMKDFRLNNKDLMSYGQGIGIGVLISVIYSIISGGFNYIYLTLIDPASAKKMTEFQHDKMIESGRTEEQYEMFMNSAIGKMMTSLSVQFVFQLFFWTFLGLILSLVIAAILKKEKSFFE